MARHSTGGVTLVELLIVITIILVLAGLLLTVTVAARNSARVAVCTSNIKQIMQAVHMYQEDYGAVPLDGSACSVRAFHWLLPYVKNPDIYMCPADPNHGVRDYCTLSDQAGLRVSYDYMYNDGHVALCGGYRDPTPRSPLVVCKFHNRGLPLQAVFAIIGRYDGSVGRVSAWQGQRMQVELEGGCEY